jgi:hypothetical protein
MNVGVPSSATGHAIVMMIVPSLAVLVLAMAINNSEREYWKKKKREEVSRS